MKSVKEEHVNELKQQNYSDEQIEALKMFDGSDDLAVKASASIYVSAGTMSNTSSKHGVRFSWSWSGTPFLAGPGIEDGVAVRWQSTNSNAVLIHTVKHADSNAFVRYGSTKQNIAMTYFFASRAAEAKFCRLGADSSELSWESSGAFISM